MNYKSILDEIQSIETDVFDSQDWSVSDLFIVGLAINAFEKQIPKEPKNIHYYKDDLLILEDYLIGYCPECGCCVDEDMTYCPDCGQKFQWELEEN